MSHLAHITAVLGATNTGKTHYAVERMLARESAVIGLPLRLLAREIYDKTIKTKGVNACALITGEEKIIPPHAQYFVCTVEAMPMADILKGKFTCVAIDEVQLMDHPERGHIFTDRVLRARGTQETMLLGANTAKPILQALTPNLRFHTRERFSVLSYSGHTKINRLPKRSVIIAFSTDEVYAIAELIRRQYGGAALVMGGSSPRTRNAQAALYQSGEVDYMVATDAIGMGLNLDADHVAFASLRKFDGTRRRYLHAHEIGQIAGRAGRFRSNGTFGTTGNSLPLDDDIVLRIENHEFTPMGTANWRNTNLHFESTETLLNSLAVSPPHNLLQRTAPVMDELVFERLLNVHDYEQDVQTQNDVKALWDICQIPDFRNLGLEAHGRLLDEIATQLHTGGGQLTDEYFETSIRRLDHLDGTVDILASRLSAIRTWSYLAQKPDWVREQKKMIFQTRKVEDKLSDALHEKLVQKFVDRRTSALLKGIGRKASMDVVLKPDGEVIVEGHVLGHLHGLQFIPGETESGLENKTLNAVANLAIAPEIDKRLIQISGSDHTQIQLMDDGTFTWGNYPVAKLARGNTLLLPDVELIGGDLGSPVLADQAASRLRDYLRTETNEKFECLNALKAFIDDPQTYEAAKPLMRVLLEYNGVLRRAHHKQIVNATDKTARGYVRNKGAQFANFYVFMRDMVKPAPARLLSLFFAYAWDQNGGGQKNPFIPQNGMSSTEALPGYSEAVLNKAGYTRLNTRFVRFDVLANLEKLIRHARAETRYGPDQFRVSREMMSAISCTYEDTLTVLKAIGYEPVSYTLSDEEFESEKSHLLKMFNARKAKQERAALGAKADTRLEKIDAPAQSETPPTQTPKTQSKPEPDNKPQTSAESSKNNAKENPEGKPEDTLQQKKVHKKRRPVVLTAHIIPPEADENGEPILSQIVDVWRPRSFKPKARTPQNQGSHSQVRADTPNTKDNAKSKSPRKRQSQNPKWRQGRDKPANTDSPFAALAGLKFSDKKDDKDN